MVELCARHVRLVAETGATLVGATDLCLNSGELVALVGPNGAGKSSLVRILAGVANHDGTVELDGVAVAAMAPDHRARKIAWMPQTLPPAWPVTVRDAVALGRFAYGATPGRLIAEDADAVERALAACDVARLADRRITTLSGGELARVHLARALATDAPVLLADEPTAALDLAHCWTLMNMLRTEASRGRLVLVVVHDLSLAARWADRIIVMDHGHIVADGPPQFVVTAPLLAETFGVTAAIETRDGILNVRVIAAAAVAAD